MFRDRNPVAQSDENDPRTDAVTAQGRPARYQSLLANDDFAQPGWNTFFTEDWFFYLDGVRAALRLFRTNSTSFLKTGHYLERAMNEPEVAELWSRQSGVPLALPVSLPRTRAIKELKPTHFQKCVLCIVAFELAIRDEITGISPYWAYDYLRIYPSVYNIHRFDKRKLEVLVADYPNFETLALKACGQDNPQLLGDLAGGATVTLRTATLLKTFLDTECQKSESHHVGEVRCRPGLNSKLGTGPASECEVLQINQERPSGDLDAANAG